MIASVFVGTSPAVWSSGSVGLEDDADHGLVFVSSYSPIQIYPLTARPRMRCEGPEPRGTTLRAASVKAVAQLNVTRVCLLDKAIACSST